MLIAAEILGDQLADIGGCVFGKQVEEVVPACLVIAIPGEIISQELLESVLTQ